MKLRKIIEYLPEYIAEYEEIKALTNAEQPIFDNAEKIIESILDNNYIIFADNTSLDRYERIMGIVSDETSPEKRKTVLLSKLLSQIPFTFRKLEEIMSNTIGKDNFELDLQNDIYKILIKINNTKNIYLSAVNNIMKIILPANFIYNILLYSKNKVEIGCASLLSCYQSIKISPFDLNRKAKN